MCCFKHFGYEVCFNCLLALLIESVGLVDGIVTDDSDVFLFGGETVYRKFFDQSSFIESYQTNEIKNQLELDRNVCSI